MNPLFVKEQITVTEEVGHPFAQNVNIGNNNRVWETTTIYVDNITTRDVYVLNSEGVRDLCLSIAVIFTVCIIIRCLFRRK